MPTRPGSDARVEHEHPPSSSSSDSDSDGDDEVPPPVAGARAEPASPAVPPAPPDLAAPAPPLPASPPPPDSHPGQRTIRASVAVGGEGVPCRHRRSDPRRQRRRFGRIHDVGQDEQRKVIATIRRVGRYDDALHGPPARRGIGVLFVGDRDVAGRMGQADIRIAVRRRGGIRHARSRRQHDVGGQPIFLMMHLSTSRKKVQKAPVLHVQRAWNAKILKLAGHHAPF